MRIQSINLSSGASIESKEGTLAFTSKQLKENTAESIKTFIDDMASRAGCFGVVKFYSKTPLDYAVMFSKNKSDVEAFLLAPKD